MSETTSGVTPERVLPARDRTPERAEFLSDVLTTAVEGGIGYWSSVSDYRWWSPTLDGGSAPHRDGQANAYVVVHCDDELPDTCLNNIDGHWYVITYGRAPYEIHARDCVTCGIARGGRLVTVDDIARALGMLRKGPVQGLNEKLRADIIANDHGNGDPEGNHQDIDAGLADCIVQVALFGEVVYG